MKISKSLTAFALSLAALSGFSTVVAFAADNGPGGRAPQDLPVLSAPPNNGHLQCSAAVNSDGTLAGRNLANPATTSRLSAGTYQVGFVAVCADVRAARGWLRIVTPDTLTTGSLGFRTCTVADRAGLISGVFVQCFNQTGALVDTSFGLWVVR